MWSQITTAYTHTQAFLDRFLVEYEKDTPARLGLLPRYGTPDQVSFAENTLRLHPKETASLVSFAVLRTLCPKWFFCPPMALPHKFPSSSSEILLFPLSK